MDQPSLPRMGELLRDQGTQQVLWAPSQDEWRELAYDWLTTQRPGQRITSTDLVDAIGMPPSPNAVGAVMRSAAVRGWLWPTDEYVRSTRPSCHAAVVRVWLAA